VYPWKKTSLTKKTFSGKKYERGKNQNRSVQKHPNRLMNVHAEVV